MLIIFTGKATVKTPAGDADYVGEVTPAGDEACGFGVCTIKGQPNLTITGTFLDNLAHGLLVSKDTGVSPQSFIWETRAGKKHGKVTTFM